MPSQSLGRDPRDMNHHLKIPASGLPDFRRLGVHIKMVFLPKHACINDSMHLCSTN